ncbi:hypothetical protein ABL78_1876 [Leptomonas seymouri]|uniref:200 kDa antigen p200 n=1 Tax=Leptomonas seymouri TaxID=5684 RepID=A0A0N1I6T1_LEPSE|nr:hypothetical protein ABL78_1876 [Leptomonas seymouri]|eukprot:KPI88992.1 hypothetical protein ABL78_1876 [Leptomonas seymouri]
MFSDSDEDEQYTVHEVDRKKDADPLLEVSPHDAEVTEMADADNAAATSPLARYYRLGTQQRHAFDEHMRRLKEEALRLTQEREFRQQHPFRPLRETAASSTLGVSSERAGENPPNAQHTEVPAEERVETVNTATTPVKPVFDRLAAQAVQLELRRRHREEQKRRAEAAALRGAFQPEINRQPPVDTDLLRHLDNIPVEERLLHYGEAVARERQRRQEMKALEEKAALRAAQRSVIGDRSRELQEMDPDGRRRVYEEFHRRSQRFLAEKEQHRLRAEEEAAGTFSFQPQISATSVALDEARQKELLNARKSELQQLLDRSTEDAFFTVSQQSTSVGHDTSRRSDALYAQAVARQRRQSHPLSRDKKVDVADERGSALDRVTQQNRSDTSPEKEGGAPYRPQTNPTSDRWIASGPHRHFFEQDFVHRQALYEQVKKEEASLKAAARQSRASSPNVGRDTARSNATEMSAATTSPRKLSTKALNERLYYSAKTAGEVAQRRCEATLNARECPFHPELSPGTHYVLQRMKHTRDGDVVKRLTSGASPYAHKRVEIAPDKRDLYRPVPSAQSLKRTSALAASPSIPSIPSKEDTGAEPAEKPARKRSALTRDQIEHFYQRQMNFLQERQDLIQERKESESVQELVECTFRPRTNTDQRDSTSAAPRMTGSAATLEDQAPSVNRVTGVAGFLERQRMARQRKAEREEALRTMGLPRYKPTGSVSFVNGTTLLNPFTLQTAQRQRRPSSSSSPPMHRTTSPTEEGKFVGVSPTWVNGLISSERALYNALENSKKYPASSTAPLFPLPGYTRFDDGEEGTYADDAEAYTEAANESGCYGEVRHNCMPRPSLRQIHPTRRGRSAEASREKTSLFSSISASAFSGRSLASGSSELHADEQYGVKRSKSATKPALKTATTADLTFSAQRRKQKRSVSFALDRSASSPRDVHTVPIVSSHVDPVRHRFL